MMTNDYEKARNIATYLLSIAEGKMREEDREEFERWVANNPSAYKLIQKLSDREKLEEFLQQPILGSKEKSALALQKKIRQRIIRRRVRTLITTAAMFIIFLASGYYLLQNKQVFNGTAQPEYTAPQIVLGNGEVVFLDQLKESENNEAGIVKTKQGELQHHGKTEQIKPDTSINRLILPAKTQYTIQLSDGSKVYVNANSTFSYPTVFYGKERRVEIQGEAFFEVAKGETPFIVVSSGVEIRAYGTSFNVNNYTRDQVETVLITGSVGVSMQGKAEVRLFPNQKAVADLSGGMISHEEVQTEAYIAWLQGNFIFEGENLDKVLKKLSQWYGIEFDLSSLTNKKIPIVAKYKQKTPLEEILQSIEFSTQVKFTNHNGKIRIQTPNI